MQNTEWPAEKYAIGSFIQATVADSLLPELSLNPDDDVLDIGCGNGAYTRKILDRVPQGTVTGIDASKNMLVLAKEVSKDYPNFSVKNDNVLTMNFSGQFDHIVSFWCLQWATDIKKAFTNMIHALKPGGKIFALFPAGDDPFIMSYYALRDSGQYPALETFKPPVNYSELDNLDEKLKTIPGCTLQTRIHHSSVALPNLDIFRKFINGISFYQGQLAEAEINRLNEAMVTWFDNDCRHNCPGEYQFKFSLYLITGEKQR